MKFNCKYSNILIDAPNFRATPGIYPNSTHPIFTLSQSKLLEYCHTHIFDFLPEESYLTGLAIFNSLDLISFEVPCTLTPTNMPAWNTLFPLILDLAHRIITIRETLRLIKGRAEQIELPIYLCSAENHFSTFSEISNFISTLNECLAETHNDYQEYKIESKSSQLIYAGKSANLKQLSAYVGRWLDLQLATLNLNDSNKLKYSGLARALILEDKEFNLTYKWEDVESFENLIVDYFDCLSPVPTFLREKIAIYKEKDDIGLPSMDENIQAIGYRLTATPTRIEIIDSLDEEIAEPKLPANPTLKDKIAYFARLREWKELQLAKNCLNGI